MISHVTLCKNSEKFHALIFCKTRNISFWVHSPLSGPKKLKTKFSEKSSIKPMLSLHTTVTSWKKSQKFHLSILLKLPHFGPSLGIFGPKTSKQGFSQKVICVNFKPLCYCNFKPKIEKFHKSIFYKTWKTSFRTQFLQKVSFY